MNPQATVEIEAADTRITQKYLRRYPDSKRTRSWAGKLVHIETENGVWRENAQGYTYAGRPEAWVLPFEDAVARVNHCGPEKRAAFILVSTSPTTAAEGIVERLRHTGDWHDEAVYEQIEELQQAARQTDSEPMEALFSDAADMAIWLMRRCDEARSLVVEANNSLYGSQGYFHSLNGGAFDKYHLASGIEALKERANSQASTISSLTAERDSLQTKVEHAQYAMDTVAKFVRPRIPADQNPEQATSFLAWIGMILRLEQRAEQAEAALSVARDAHSWPAEAEFEYGDWVEKFTGEAMWEGRVVSAYHTKRLALRYVVEVDPQGFQMIAVPAQLRLALKGSPNA